MDSPCLVRSKRIWVCTIFALALAIVCVRYPARSEEAFAPFMSPAQESRIGAEEHPKMLERFGGVYKDRDVSGYVAEVGGRLVHHAQLSNRRFTFTVLNTSEVNAFALPGGYVYVTRGLLALANSEAELAGVLAHEIGHVVARHSAQRYSRAMLARLGGALLNTLTNNDQVDRFVRLGSDLYLSSYSREQEHEADLLGIGYLSRVGYDPSAQADFLANLSRYSALKDRIDGSNSKKLGPVNLFSTHPRTADRVQRTIENAGTIHLVSHGLRRRVEFLQNIKGLIYGDDPSQGFVRGQTFFHPNLHFTFSVPPRFRLTNMSKAVVADGPDEVRIILDSVTVKDINDPLSYITKRWMSGINLHKIERININGLDAATARARIKRNGGFVDARFVAIRFDTSTIYRLLFISEPSKTANLEIDFRSTTYSFRRLDAEEAASLKPFRIRIVAIREGDDLDSLVARMPSQTYAKEWFLVLNGLTETAPLQVGRLVKLLGD